MARGLPETQKETLEQLSRRSNYFFVYFFQNFQVVSGNYGNYPGSATVMSANSDHEVRNKRLACDFEVIGTGYYYTTLLLLLLQLLCFYYYH